MIDVIAQQPFRSAAMWLLAVAASSARPAAQDAEVPAPRVVTSQSPAGLDWPIYRGNAALHGVAPGSPPQSLELRWTFQSGSAIVSSPVIVGGLVFVGSDDGHLYCVALATGELAWRTELGDVIEAPPLWFDGVVYVGGHDFFFYAVDASTGDIRWKYETDERIVGGANVVMPADGSGALIVVGSHDNRLYAFDPRTGERRWMLETNDRVNATPAVVGDSVIFGGCDTVVYVVNGATGETRHRIELGGDCHIAGPVAVTDERIYAGHSADAFIALDRATGARAWTFEKLNSGFFGAPAVTSDRVVFGGRDRMVHVADRATGDIIWSFATRRKVDAAPVVWGDSVVAGSGDGRLYVLALEDGAERWSYDVGKSIYSSPAIAQGMIVVGANDGRLYAFGAPADPQAPRE